MTSNGANFEMFALARESRGASQAQLSEVSGISQAAISKIENGLQVATEDQVKSLSIALEYPATFFMRSGQQYGFGTACHNRKRSSLPIKSLRRVHATMNVLRMAILDLLRGIDIDTTLNFPQLDIDDFGSPEAVARLLRQSWQMPTGPVQDLMALIEAAGGLVILTDFGTDKLDAVCQRPSGQPPFFFASFKVPGDRLRFSMAHELGHVIMHSTPKPDVDVEREADRFAAEFLMPETEIRGDLVGLNLGRLAVLKQFWRVSMQALIMRAKTTGAITESQAKSMFVRFSQLGYRKNEPVDIPREQPRLVRDVIQFHRAKHGYTDDELKATARLGTREFDALTDTSSRPSLRLV